jgi:hypothetical protein
MENPTQSENATHPEGAGQIREAVGPAPTTESATERKFQYNSKSIFLTYS